MSAARRLLPFAAIGLACCFAGVVCQRFAFPPAALAPSIAPMVSPATPTLPAYHDTDDARAAYMSGHWKGVSDTTTAHFGPLPPRETPLMPRAGD